MDSNDNWPGVSPGLIAKLEDWAQSRSFASYRPGMTGEEALGSLAEVAGVGIIIAKLKRVYQRQHDETKIANIPSHVRSDDATTGPRPNNPRRWRSGDLSQQRAADRTP